MEEIPEHEKCEKCGKDTIMYSFVGNGFYCLEHYNEFIGIREFLNCDKDFTKNKQNFLG